MRLSHFHSLFLFLFKLKYKPLILNEFIYTKSLHIVEQYFIFIFYKKHSKALKFGLEVSIKFKGSLKLEHYMEGHT